MPSMKACIEGSELTFRAMTFGIATGFTSDALPTRSHRDPGCMTMTWEPRLHYFQARYEKRFRKWHVGYLCSVDGGSVSSG